MSNGYVTSTGFDCVFSSVHEPAAAELLVTENVFAIISNVISAIIGYNYCTCCYYIFNNLAIGRYGLYIRTEHSNCMAIGTTSWEDAIPPP